MSSDDTGATKTYVETSVADRVATLTISDPERRNALNMDMVEQIEAAVDDIEANPEVGALVVTGNPPAFCAGADLSQLGASREQGLRRIYEGFLRIGRSPLPTLAAVNGAAVGAGVNLLLCCDVRLAATSAKIDTRFLALGIGPGGGHTWMLRRIVGPQATMATVIFGDVLDGAEAERIGLAWRHVPDDELMAQAQAMAAKAAAAPRQLVERTKANIEAMADITTHDEAVDKELVDQVWSMDQPAFADKLAALQKKISSKS